MLPSPLIPSSAYADWIAFGRSGTRSNTSTTTTAAAGGANGASGTPDSSSDTKLALKGLVAKVPLPERYVLQYLCEYLYDFSQTSDVTKMSPDNLAIVFAPNLLRPESDLSPQAMLADSQFAIVAISALIRFTPFIF